MMHIAADVSNYASSVATQDHRPSLDEPAEIALLPVDRVDCNGVIFDNHLVCINRPTRKVWPTPSSHAA
ncbi:hypothetical protein BTUL_0255g00150 [Botrytis tulipae]|uniref:Uncharacterized protein n=1 Tax=Botrytis tulipae TaxID=87230 RepID=A0A4Z1EA64_9HELO|nr:hypothetical protein BTUL_0255g00150 [Botrytis tulipae]